MATSSSSLSFLPQSPAAASPLLLLLLLSLLLWTFPSRLDAFDALDPHGSITIKWDVRAWTADGYVAEVTMYNFQLYRHIQLPGWILGWSWAQDEVIWSMVGAQATMQGDCSEFHTGVLPHSCKRDPQIVDLLPGVPYNSQIGNCCRGGVLSSYLQDPAQSVAAFQLAVGRAGTSNTTVQLPINFNLATPGPGYTCGPAVLGKQTLFPSPDGRRFAQALMTWNVTCVYTQLVAQKAPTCCVSYSAFYNDAIVPCQTCSCACQANITSLSASPTCVEATDQYAVATARSSGSKSPGLYCTNDMCPIRIHWHIKANYVEHWRVKITITNRNLFKNFTQWNIVAQHPNFDNFTQAFSFTYKGISPYGDTNDTAVFYGLKYFNDMLISAGPDGNVQSEILFRKDPSSFTFKQGWAFPRRIYFNGDNCVLPDPDDYPQLPSAALSQHISGRSAIITSLLMMGSSTLTFLLVLAS